MSEKYIYYIEGGGLPVKMIALNPASVRGGGVISQ